MTYKYHITFVRIFFFSWRNSLFLIFLSPSLCLSFNLSHSIACIMRHQEPPIYKRGIWAMSVRHDSNFLHQFSNLYAKLCQTSLVCIKNFFKKFAHTQHAPSPYGLKIFINMINKVKILIFYTVIKYIIYLFKTNTTR